MSTINNDYAAIAQGRGSASLMGNLKIAQRKGTILRCANLREELTLIAGLAGEAGMALALTGSHAVSMLTAGLAHSCSGRIQRGRDRSVQRPGRLLVPDQDDKELNPYCFLTSTTPLAVNYLFTPHHSNKRQHDASFI